MTITVKSADMSFPLPMVTIVQHVSRTISLARTKESVMSNVYQMVITSDDPDRYLPGSWNFMQSPGMTVWETALDIAKREHVTVLRVLDDNGKEIPR